MINKTLNELDRLMASNNLAVDENTRNIDKLQERNLMLMAEAQAAKNVADNIRNMIAQ